MATVGVKRLIMSIQNFQAVTCDTGQFARQPCQIKLLHCSAELGCCSSNVKKDVSRGRSSSAAEDRRETSEDSAA